LLIIMAVFSQLVLCLRMKFGSWAWMTCPRILPKHGDDLLCTLQF
uniref:Innexin n=1 Tax=Haemonchus placei TaxID=6290 RepID=A0A0N4W834_HAEPC